MTQSAVATIPTRNSLVAKFASRYSIEADKLMPILKATAFKVKDGEATNEQMAALLVVADQYGLNPFTKEIFAFPDKQNGIVPVVGVDGWSRIINDHPQFDGMDFRQSEEMVTLPDAQPCPKWMEVVIHRKDRSHPIVVREYLDEVYRPLGTYKDGNKMKAGPWQTHTKRFLRHKTLIQGSRIAFGFGGIYDEDEAQRIIDMGTAEVVQQQPVVEQPRAKSDQKPAAPVQQTQDVSDAVVVEKKSETVDGDGVIHESTDDKPMLPGQLKILRAKMANAALTDIDLIAKFGPIENLKFSQFAAVQAWTQNPAG